jgi:hypothetical protein
MEGLTRLVTESLARHGFDRPLDYRRLHWSRWFRCDSPHSLLFVPSKPGVFAVAEEILDLGTTNAHVATDALVRPASEASAPVWERVSDPVRPSEARQALPATPAPRRMLAVTQFFEDDDMAFVLDRMLSRRNPMYDRLASGRYFVRFVVVEDPTQRHSICNALNQWMVSSAEKATGIGSHFATSLELTPATEYIPQPDDRQQSLFPASEASAPVWDRVSDPVRPSEARQARPEAAQSHVATGDSPVQRPRSGAAPSTPANATLTHIPTSPQLDSGAAANLHCPTPIPSGF